MIKAVFFDFFDVLVTDGERQFFEKYVAEGGPEEAQTDTLNDSFMSGMIDYQTYRQKLAEITKIPLEEVGKWLDDNRLNDSLLEYIRTNLKDKYRLGIISNAGDDWVAQMLGAENAELFDTMTLSYQVGYMKPAPEIYQAAMKALDVAPVECVFIDDKPRYVQAAEALGIAGITFKNTKQFIRDFEALEAT